jgi:hypothetical protein
MNSKLICSNGHKYGQTTDCTRGICVLVTGCIFSKTKISHYRCVSTAWPNYFKARSLFEPSMEEVSEQIQASSDDFSRLTCV